MLRNLFIILLCFILLNGCYNDSVREDTKLEVKIEDNSEVKEEIDEIVQSEKSEMSVENKNGSEMEDPLNLVGVYKYEYEYNTDNLVEDHYIVLENQNGSIVGRYYGTSDEFDEAREGYRPGFFVLDMQELYIDEGLISFQLSLDSYMTYANPVELNILDYKAIDTENNPLWVNSHLSGTRSYTGKIINEEIVIETQFGDRIFLMQ